MHGDAFAEDSTLVEVKTVNVPQFLKGGDFFMSLNLETDDDLISVPSHVLKAEATFQNENELQHLLRSLRFWGVDSPDYQKSIVEYVFATEGTDSIRKIIVEFRVLPIMQVLHKIFCCAVSDIEASFRTLGLVQYLHLKHHRPPNHPEWLPPFLKDPDCITKDGRLEILYYLIDKCCIEHYSPDILLFMKNLGLKANVSTADWAAEQGDLHVLTQLFEQGVVSRSACFHSAKNGHLNCLTYAHSVGCHLHNKTSLIAAQNGHLQILQYLHANQCPFHFKCCRFAAAGGHRECLKFLHEAGYPWAEFVPSQAAMYGQFECLKYAHENGCPWNYFTCKDAAAGRHLVCLKYAVDNGCPIDDPNDPHTARDIKNLLLTV